jgi:hypothetical protein
MSDDDELSKLKKEVAALKDQLNPPPRPPSNHPRFDPTEGMTMPRSAMLEMMRAVPDSLMRDLRGDARRPNPVTGGPAPQPSQVRRGSGWVSPAPLTSPPGVEHCDRLVDAQDQIDRVELARKIAQARLNKEDD